MGAMIGLFGPPRGDVLMGVHSNCGAETPDVNFSGSTSSSGQVETDGAMLAAVQKKFPEILDTDESGSICKRTEECAASSKSKRGRHRGARRSVIKVHSQI
ncbi:Hypothetical predicted protein [Scomber scombrus]|uniref:Uncharacterized protein n=1 Tax=Scomber scombrus TaxID=13677 RepID=A0AAV1PI43_SCOSC